MFSQGLKWLATASVVLFVVALFTAKMWPSLKAHMEERAKVRAENEKLQRQIDHATRQVEEAAKNPEGYQNATDVWGTPLSFINEGTAVVTTLVVSSGPDKQLGNNDDISADCTAFSLNGFGKKVGHGAGEFGQGALKGLKDSVMERWNGHNKD